MSPRYEGKRNYWINNELLTARRGSGNRLCVNWNTSTETACRARITASGHLNPAARRSKPRARR